MRRKQILQAGASGNGRSVEAVSGGTELVGGLSGGEIDRVGWSFGAGRGPTPGRTWAAEACMLASLRATMADQEVGTWSKNPRRSSWETRSDSVRANQAEAAERGVTDDRSVQACAGEHEICQALASNLLSVVRVVTSGGVAPTEGILVEVQQGPSGCGAVFSLLQLGGTLVRFRTADVSEVTLCTLGGSADAAAVLQLAQREESRGLRVPPEAFDDLQLVTLRLLPGSCLSTPTRPPQGQLDLSGCKGLAWLVMRVEVRQGQIGGARLGSVRTVSPRAETSKDSRGIGWMVKVAARESTGGSGAGVGGERWVAVEDVMPMSDYDLEVYSTYRHQLLPSSEYDLQRHDAALHLRYRRTTMRPGDDPDDHVLIGAPASIPSLPQRPKRPAPLATPRSRRPQLGPTHT